MNKMISVITGFIALACILSSCVTTQLVKPDDDLRIHGNAVMTMSNNAKIDISRADSEGDSLIINPSYVFRQKIVSKTDVKRIVVIDNRKAAIRGILIGASIGVASGLVAGEGGSGDPLDNRFFAAFVWGGIAAAAGGAAGYVIGDRQVHKFDATKDERTKVKDEGLKMKDERGKDTLGKRRSSSSKIESLKKPFVTNRIRRKWYMKADGGLVKSDFSVHDKSGRPSYNNGSGVGFSGMYEVGLNINDNFLIGGFAGGAGYDKHHESKTINRNFVDFGIATTFFLLNSNLYFRTGLSGCQYAYNYDQLSNEDFVIEDNRRGYAVHLGAGYVHWMGSIGNNLNLTFQAGLVKHFIKGDSSNWLQFSVGLMWF